MAPGDDETRALTLADLDRIKRGDMTPMGDPVFVILPPSAQCSEQGRALIEAWTKSGAMVTFMAALPALPALDEGDVVEVSGRLYGSKIIDESHLLVSPPAVPSKKVDPRPWVRSRAEQWKRNRRGK